VSNFSRMVPMLVAAGLASTQQEELEDVWYTAVDMAYVAVTQLELAGMNTVVMTSAAGDELPADISVNFAGFLRENFTVVVGGGDPSLDPWGDPYRLRSTDEAYEISSSGPDGTFDTADDLVTNVKKR
jgi:hypothetical protein